MIKDFKNWIEVTRGIFRYVIAAGAAYEIQLEHHYVDTDVLTAKASLYIAGDWCPAVKEGEVRHDYFSRECLLEHQTVQECLEAAALDDATNNCDSSV